MLQTIRDVVVNHACTGCGTCVGVCPTNALRMAETPAGYLHPKMDARRCTECGLCHLVCPQIHVSTAMRSHFADPFVGPIKRAVLAHASDERLWRKGQTGGLIRALVAWMLQSGQADAALCVVDNRADPIRPLATLVRDPQECLRIPRSKYCPVPVNALLNQVRSFHGRVVYVGLGCSMQGLQLALERIPRLREKLALRIGLFCAGIMSYAAAAHLVRCSDVLPQNLQTFEYRSKTEIGWPGVPEALAENGRSVHPAFACDEQVGAF